MSVTSQSELESGRFSWIHAPLFKRPVLWGSALIQRARVRLHRIRRARKNHQRQEAIESASRAIALYNAREYEQAEAQFRAAIARDPHYARAHYGLGNTLSKRNKSTEARMAWMRAAEVEPGSDCAAKAQEKLQRRG